MHSKRKTEYSEEQTLMSGPNVSTSSVLTEKGHSNSLCMRINVNKLTLQISKPAETKMIYYTVLCQKDFVA